MLFYCRNKVPRIYVTTFVWGGFTVLNGKGLHFRHFLGPRSRTSPCKIENPGDGKVYDLKVRLQVISNCTMIVLMRTHTHHTLSSPSRSRLGTGGA